MLHLDNFDNTESDIRKMCQFINKFEYIQLYFNNQLNLIYIYNNKLI